MKPDSLSPETAILLQIHLDRLEHTSEACRRGLRELRGGKLTRDGYREMLTQQVRAQEEWEAKNREYLCSAD